MSLSVDVSNGNNAIECIQQQSIHTSYLGNWSGLIHIMALSSVLNLPVFSVYPESSRAIRPLFHGVIHLRTFNYRSCSDILYIMFTRDSNLNNDKGTIFQPNHFCPLFQSDKNSRIASNANVTSFQMHSLVPDIQSTEEFPALSSEKTNKKKDIRSFFKCPIKKIALENPVLKANEIIVENRNECVSSELSASQFKTITRTSSGECDEGRSPSTKFIDITPECRISTKCLLMFRQKYVLMKPKVEYGVFLFLYFHGDGTTVLQIATIRYHHWKRSNRTQTFNSLYDYYHQTGMQGVVDLLQRTGDDYPKSKGKATSVDWFSAVLKVRSMET